MTDHQFVWYMLINALVAIGTIGAVIVALFGKKFFPPKLELTLVSPNGELTGWKNKEGKQEYARFYHVRVSNERRWSPATDVSMHIIAMLEERADHELHEDWRGDIQITWRFRSNYPQPTRVGKAVDYDIVSVNDQGYVSLHPIAAASSFRKVRNGKCRFTILLQAKSAEGDSDVAKANISWDGTWDETEAMAKHFIIRLES